MYYVSNKNEQLTICNNQKSDFKISINILILSSTRTSRSRMGNRSSSKSTNSSQKEISSVTTKNPVVCVLISGTSSGAWVKDLIGNILAGKASCSSGKTGIKSSIASKESCVGIVAAAA